MRKQDQDNQGIHIVQRMLSRISFKGWELDVEKGSSEGTLVIRFRHPTLDAYEHVPAILHAGVTIHEFELITGIEGLARMIYERLLSLTIHEFQENFKVDGKIVLNPHFKIEEKQ